MHCPVRARHLRPHLRHRPHSRRARRIPGVGGQPPPLPVRGELHAGESLPRCRGPSRACSRADGVRPVESYSDDLLKSAAAHRAGRRRSPNVVLLTPGRPQQRLFRALRFLARRWECRGLVEGRDLSVQRRASTCARRPGPSAGRCHLPPHLRRLPGSDRFPFRLHARCSWPRERLSRRPCRARQRHRYQASPARCKVIYAYVPQLIRNYYLGEDPILPNVEHLSGARRNPSEAHPRQHRKPRRESRATRPAATGCSIGPGAATKAECAAFRRTRSPPTRAQLHRPGSGHAARRSPYDVVRRADGRPHIDLRPYILYGEKITGRRPAGSRASRCARGRSS